LHESPWGDSRQVNTLIEQGFVGDGVLLPEYLCDRVPVVGRGMAIWQVRVSRPGEPVHEVLGGIEQPSVIAAGADVIRRFSKLDRTLAATTHPLGGRESLFIGQAAGGEMYNQSPTRFTIDGTRRWLSPTTPEQAERQLREVLATVEHGGANLDADFILVRDAFEFSPDDPLVNAFQSASTAIMGQPLPIGAKPFVDDGNAFVSRGGVCAITHGPDAQGAHTANESVPVDELVRVANVYALTAIAYCAT